MCSRSTGLMLGQNSRAWLKWSAKDAGASRTFARPGDRQGVSMYAPVTRVGEERAAAVQGVGPVGGDTRMHGVLVEAVAEHVVDGRVRTVDRDLRRSSGRRAG